jgi:hypothetical protein
VIARSAWCVARRLLRSSSTPPSSLRSATAAKLLTKDEARRIAANIAKSAINEKAPAIKLPGLVSSELSYKLYKRLTLFDDLVGHKVDIFSWRFSASMRRFWRDLDRLTRFVHLGLSPFDGHFD